MNICEDHDSSAEVATAIAAAGPSIAITSQPEVEWLRKKIELLEFENKIIKLTLEEQRRYIKSVDQMIYSVQAPVATLNILLEHCIAHCISMPENLRSQIRSSVVNINSIVQDMIRHKRESAPPCDELAVPLLLSTTLINIISEKKYQYRKKSIRLNYHFSPESFYSFIQIQASAFRCMVSTLIDNAVTAIESRDGQVCIFLELGDHGGERYAKISVEDNAGTKTALSFPLSAAPEWMAKMMVVNPDDIIVILDQEPGNHEAWDAYFAQALLQFHKIKIKHFTLSEDAIAFIRSLSEQDRRRVLMLTDYDLARHDFDGLKVLDTLHPDKKLLVANHYPDTYILQRAARLNSKIIPKQLVNQIPIYIQC